MGKTFIFLFIKYLGHWSFLPEQNYLFSSFFFCVCMCVYCINMQIILKGVYTCEYMEARGHWMCSSMTLHLVILRQDLSLKLELRGFWLGWQPTGPSDCLSARVTTHTGTGLTCCMGVVL